MKSILYTTFITLIFITSCSKEETSYRDNVSVSVKIMGIEDNEKNKVDLNASSKLSNNINYEGDKGILTIGSQFDFLTSLSVKGKHFDSTYNKTAAIPNNSIILVPSTHYYQLVICSDDLQTIHYNETLLNSSFPSIMLEPGH